MAVNKRDACIAINYRPKTQAEPSELSVVERQLFEASPSDFEWAKEKIKDLPDYLTKYFVNRYISILEKVGHKHANTFLRTKVVPASERVALVLQKYKALPTLQKISLLSKEIGEGEDPFHSAFFTEHRNPEDFQRDQMSFDFDQLEQHRKPVKNRILAELEIDELKEMAFKISMIVNRFWDISTQKNQGESEEEIDECCKATYEEVALFVTETFGVKAPRKFKKQTSLSALNDISRMICEKWWLGRLTKLRKIMREHLAIAMGQVSSKASPYASWDCVREHVDQQQRNWEYIKQCELLDEETEETASLEEMVLKSVSNPAIRRHELMVRCRGCEDIGDELGLQGLFLTLTTPSKYHNSYNKGGFIDHWNGASPRDSQAYLNNVWQKVRAKLGRDEIRWFGVRVAEPHHDGTPHWHLLIWVKPEDVAAVRGVFIDYATHEDRDELTPCFDRNPKRAEKKQGIQGPINYKPRCDFGYIDPAKGTATGYIAKYISKNIDGFAMDNDVSDETGKSIKDMAKNVSAWKSRWNIRQFQFFGGAPVTTYRELRRFASQNKKAFMEYLFIQKRVDLLTIYYMLQRDLVGPIKPSKLITNQELMKVIGDSYQARGNQEQASVSGILAAADHGNWQGYINGQGGPFVKRKDLLIINDYEVLPFASPHGEEVRKIQGFSTSEATVKTRIKVWTIRRKDEGGDQAEAGALAPALDLALSGASGSSRSSVNNCTQPHGVQVSDQLSRLMVPNKEEVKKRQEIDESAVTALLKGSHVRLDDETSLRIRPPTLDENGNVRPAQLIEVNRKVESDGNWLNFDGWESALQPEQKNTEKDNEYQQPDLSFFPEREDDWPLI
nr:replication endonuclease [Vibrio nigripulchritudo]